MRENYKRDFSMKEPPNIFDRPSPVVVKEYPKDFNDHPGTFKPTFGSNPNQTEHKYTMRKGG